MPQPVWITPAGSLGTVPEGTFYSIPIQATAGDQSVFFKLIAGELPNGVQVTSNGVIEGTPRTTVRVQGTPQEVGADVTSRFAIRAYTTRTVNGKIFVDRLADRTFTITVSGQDAPEFVTPAGNIGTFYDGTEAIIPIEFIDVDSRDDVRIRVLSGELPPGLTLNNRTGLISGIILPLVGPPGTATAGYDETEFDLYEFDFSTRAASKNYQFTLEVSDGVLTSTRTFEIYVYARNTMSADTTTITADNTFVTADVTPDRAPLLLTPEGDLGRVRADNWFAYKFTGLDFDGEPIEYVLTTGGGVAYDDAPYDTTAFSRSTLSLPPGLQVDPDTGWFYGYIPNQGVTEQTYRFAIRVQNKVQLAPVWNASVSYGFNDAVSYVGTNFIARTAVPAGILPTNTAYWAPEVIPISRFYYFTITIIGNIDTEVFWLTDPDLGTINNGDISTLFVQATNSGGKVLQYRLQSGSDSKLPQGLTLQPSGNITGRVSFNTFALDGGTTTFDKNLNTRLDINETTFDLQFDFTVNAFSSDTEQIGYKVGSIVLTNGGSGYTSQPTITISAPPGTENSIQATAGIATIVGGVITSIAVGNPGRGYLTPPTVTITGGGGVGATAIAQIIEAELTNAISVFRRFTLRVNRAYNEPYESLYVKCMPSESDRSLIDQLIQNQDIIPNQYLYRADDPNFGSAKNVIYNHAYGLTSAVLQAYVESMRINHYWKNITLGGIRTAQALAPDGSVQYEVVYSPIIDNLVNNQGVSVNKSVKLPYPVTLDDGTVVTTVYPNSLDNMRNQVIDTVGQVAPGLPLWMVTKQADGRVLGFTPAWVIAYVQPGQANRIAYNIIETYGDQLNLIDFKVDRYELGRSQTHNWDPATQQWVPQPPAATTFDQFASSASIVGWENNILIPVGWRNDESLALPWINTPTGITQTGTRFDGGSTTFINIADRWTNTDAFDKYLLFPRTNILEPPQ